MKIGKPEQKLLVYGVGAIALYAFVLKPILNKFGITESAADKANKDAGLTQSAWNANFWSKFGSPPIDNRTAESVCDSIYSAFGIFQDDYDTVLGVLRSLDTKAQVSYVTWYFNKEYNADLYAFLNSGGGVLPWDGLSTTHLTEINKYVSSLPDK